jgi:acyl-CoA thioesterase
MVIGVAPVAPPPPGQDDPLAQVRERWASDPFLRLLGIEVVEVAPGRSKLRLRVSESIRNGGRSVPHGGALSSAIDIAIGIAVNAANRVAGEGPIGQTTTDLNVSFLEGSMDEELTVEASLVRRGRSLAVGEATVRDSAGRAVAVGRATFMLFRRDGPAVGMGSL